MAEHAGPALLARTLLDFGRHYGTDAAQARFPVLRLARGGYEFTILLSGPFGHDDDREMSVGLFTLADFGTDTFVCERNLRDQDHVGTTGDPGVDRDPARITAHDF